MAAELARHPAAFLTGAANDAATGNNTGPAPQAARRVAIAAVVAVVLAIVLGETIYDVVSSSSGARLRALRSWEAVAAPIIAEQNALAATVTEFRSHAPSATRPADDNTLALLGRVTADERQAVRSLGIAPPNSRAGDLLNGVVTNRSEAVTALTSGYAAATSPDHPVAAATSSFAVVGRDLATADADYLVLLKLVRPIGGRGLLPAHSRWDPTLRSWNAAGAAAFAEALAGAGHLTAHAAIDLVAVSVNPTPVGITGLPAAPTTTSTTTTSTTIASTTSTSPVGNSGTGGTSGTSTTTTSTTSTTTTTIVTRLPQIVPAGAVARLYQTSTVTVTGIVRDPGNVALTGVSVAARMTPQEARAGVPVPAPATVTLGTIGAGRSRFVNVPTFSVTPGVTYVLTVTVSADAAASVERSFTLKIEK